MGATTLWQHLRMLLTDFNQAPPHRALAMLEQCARIPSWSAALVAARPVADRNSLLVEADRSAHGWTPEQVGAALSDHPRIGGQRSSYDALTLLSTGEQSGVADDDETRDRLAAGNAAYEARFGRIFLIRATGRDQDEVLAELGRRLTNDDLTEWVETSRELREIALLRLAQEVVQG